MMVMTILEGRVSPENWKVLEQAYQEGVKQVEPGLVQSFLVHATHDVEIWRILTVWSSREALNEMRKAAETPRGILMFRSANSEPVLSIFEVVQEINPA